MKVNLLYFASLRDAAGMGSETIDLDVFDKRIGSLADLYAVLQQRYGFALPIEKLRVAVDGAFARWEDLPRENAEIAFIPPVSGG